MSIALRASSSRCVLNRKLSICMNACLQLLETSAFQKATHKPTCARMCLSNGLMDLPESQKKL